MDPILASEKHSNVHPDQQQSTASRLKPVSTAVPDIAGDLQSKMVNWKRKNAKVRSTAATVDAQQHTPSSTASSRARDATGRKQPELIAKQLYEPDADMLVRVQHRPVRKRVHGRDLGGGGGGGDPDGSPGGDEHAFRAGVARGRGTSMGRGRRGGRGRQQAANVGQRFDSDDDEQWYMRGEPDDRQAAPKTVNPGPTDVPSTPIPPSTTAAHHSRMVTNAAERRTLGRRHVLTVQTRQQSAGFSAKDETTTYQRHPATPTDGKLSIATPNTPGSSRQLFDPETGTMKEAKSHRDMGAVLPPTPSRRARPSRITDMDGASERGNPVLAAINSEVRQLEKQVSAAFRSTEDDGALVVDSSADQQTQWRSKMDLCHALLAAYDKLITLSRENSSTDRSSFPIDAYQRFWRYGVYQLMDALRQRIKFITTSHSSTGDTTEARKQTDELRRLLNEHISASEEFYNNQLSQVAMQAAPVQQPRQRSRHRPARPNAHPHAVTTSVIALGDLARYRGMFGLASGGEVDTLRRYWLKKARAWYRLAIRLQPSNGKVYNQLAILSAQHELEAMYYYCRSLVARDAFTSARESLLMLTEANRQRFDGMSATANDQPLTSALECTLTRLHGILFNRTRQLSALSLGSPPQMDAAIWFLYRTAVLNIIAVHLYKPFAQVPECTGSAKTAADYAAKLTVETSVMLWQESELTDDLLVYTLVLAEWLAGDRWCRRILFLLNGPTANTSNGVQNLSFYAWIDAFMQAARPIFWQHLASLLSRAWQELQCTNSVPEGITSQTPIPLDSRPVPEDYELQGLPWSAVIVSAASLAPFDVTRLQPAEDAVEFIDTDYGHWKETSPDWECSEAHSDGMDQTGSSGPHRTVRLQRLLRLGAVLSALLNGFTMNHDESTFLVEEPLLSQAGTRLSFGESDVDGNEECHSEDGSAHQSETGEHGNTSADELAFYDSTDVEIDALGDDIGTEHDAHDTVAALKSRKRELEQLLSAERTRRSDLPNTQGYSRCRSMARARPEQKMPSRPSIQPEAIKTLLIDTNMFISDLPKMKRLVQSTHWTIVLPLAVITELDGLQRSPPPLGTAAQTAITYLESLFTQPAGGRPPIRIQTARGNYLPDIRYRSEMLDDLDGEIDRWESGEHDSGMADRAAGKGTPQFEVHSHGSPDDVCDMPRKTLDDVILSVCQRHIDAGCCLITGDANLRVKAHAHGVPIISGNAVNSLLRSVT